MHRIQSCGVDSVGTGHWGRACNDVVDTRDAGCGDRHDRAAHVRETPWQCPTGVSSDIDDYRHSVSRLTTRHVAPCGRHRNQLLASHNAGEELRLELRERSQLRLGKFSDAVVLELNVILYLLGGTCCVCSWTISGVSSGDRSASQPSSSDAMDSAACSPPPSSVACTSVARQGEELVSGSQAGRQTGSSAGADAPGPQQCKMVVGGQLSPADLCMYVHEKLWRCPPLAGAPGAAGSGQELTVPPGRSRHAVLKKITERSRP